MSDVKDPTNFLPIKLSKKDFLSYKEKLEKFFSTRKPQYQNLFESFDVLKQKKLHLSYLLFSYYNSWIFPYISYTKITRGNIFSSSFEISFIFKKLSKDMNCPFDEKLFILWYFFLYYNFFIKAKKNGTNTTINQIRYILFETGKIVINLFEQKLLSIQSVINILDMNLFCFEYFIVDSGFSIPDDKKQKLNSIKLIIFLNFFHLLKEVSIITLKQNTGFEIILSYLDKIKQNSEINDEVNIILLFNNNILQDFVQTILDNINIVELIKTIPEVKNKLVEFYAHFLKNRYKISKTFNFLQDTLRHSFEHLYNFKQNKNLIINDAFKIDFNSEILNKLFSNNKNSSNHLEKSNQLNSSFFFDSKESSITFEINKKLQLEQTILFFSFRNNNINIEQNKEMPLLILYTKNSKKKEKTMAVLKIFLKKDENGIFKLYFSQQKDQKDETMKIINETSDIIIKNNQTYYCAFYLLGKKPKIYLLEDSLRIPEICKKEISLVNQLKEDLYLFNLGADDKKKVNFYKGCIGPFIIIKAPKVDNIDKHIEDILLLKEQYKDFIITKSDLSNSYNFNLKNYFSIEYLKESSKTDKIKGNFDCLLYLTPDILTIYKNKMLNGDFSKESQSKKIPGIYDCVSSNIEFNIIKFDVNIFNDENFVKLFLADNGTNYFCLLFEYFDQLFRFYLLKKDKEKIFEENEMELLMNYSISSIKNNLLMAWKNNYSKYIYDSSKSILNNLYNCLMNMNKIEPILGRIYEQLLYVKTGIKSVLLNYINSYGKNQKNITYDLKNKNDFEKFNKSKFVEFNINLFIGIIEILLTPEFYNLNDNRVNIVIIEKIFNSINNEIKATISMLDLSLMDNIFYKLLSFVQMISEYFDKNENENEGKNEIVINENKNKKEHDIYQKLIKNIFGSIIGILNSKYIENNNIVENYFHKLFLFVFGSHIYNYDLVLNYLSVIDNDSSNLKFKEHQIIELKDILFKFEKYKEDKGSENKDNIKVDINEEKIRTIQSFIINKIYEFIFLNIRDDCPIKINFLEELIKNKNISNYIFIQIQNLLKTYFVDIFNEDNISNTFLGMDSNQINKYLKKIFEFLRFFLNILCSQELKNLKESSRYLDFTYDLMYEAQANMKIQEENFEKCIVFLLNYIEFIYTSLFEEDDDKNNFLYHEAKIVKIIEELFDKCVESTLIHCDFYLLIKDEKNLTSSTQEKKLIAEIFFEFYAKLLMAVHHEYCIPEKNTNKINRNDIAFVQGLNTFLGKKLISEFNFDAYDIKNLPYLQKFKSIFFLSDFYKLSSQQSKYYKKYSKIKLLKDYPQQMTFYQKMQSTIISLKPDFVDLNNQFDFFHTTYFFNQLYELYNIKLISFVNEEEIQKREDLRKCLEEAKLSMMSLKNILINDHLKMNLICKDFYFKKKNTNDNDLKNMLKTIQAVVFNKKLKNIEKLDLIKDIETEFKNGEVKPRKSTNSRESNNSNGSNPKKGQTNSIGSKDSSDGGTPGKTSDNIIITDINIESNNPESNEFTVTNENNIKKEETVIIKEQEKPDIKKVTINESFNDQIESLKQAINNSHYKNILEKIDKFSIINPKKEFMKTIFGTYFEEAFYENTTFKKLKMLFLNTITSSNQDTKILNYPSKIKNFMNGLEPCNFLKENDKFFITKIFPITHTYFYDYMKSKNLLNDSIILLKTNLLNEKNVDKEDANIIDCELIKTDKIYFGQLINSKKDKFLFFQNKNFEMFDEKLDSQNVCEQIKQRGFSLSALKHLDTENAKKAKEKAKNYLLDSDIYPEEEISYEKKILIFYDDIEEIVERRILYRWQGLEIFLKNGKSYMINLLNKTNYELLVNSLKEIPNILFREKEFLNDRQEIMQQWRAKKMDTYEYLLYINKFSSRSYNDISQYYIFPWLLLDFSKISDINKYEKEIFEFLKTYQLEKIMKKQQKEKEKKQQNDKENNDKENNEKNKKAKKDKKEKKEKSDSPEKKQKTKELNSSILELIPKFRNFNYPVSAQLERQRQIKREKYSDEDEKFSAHHGTHYSTSSYVEYYLMRNEPYTTLIVELQNYSQEDPNRLLLRLKDTITIINSGYDNREIIPELFSKIEHFVNVNCGFFGIKKNKEFVDDIDLLMENEPIDIYNNITYDSKFILAHKKLLNSDIIALNINKWIDNVFGYMQIPPQKKILKSINIFPKSTYEKFYNLEEKFEKISTKYEGNSNKIIKKFTNKINVINSFGQCPHQIFSEELKNRDLFKLNPANSEENGNYGLQDDIRGADFIDTYVQDQLKNDNTEEVLKNQGLYFEINPEIEKVFILNGNGEITIADTNFYSLSNPKKYNWIFIPDIKLPQICLFNKIEIEKENYFYIFNLKYAFSSFPSDNNTNTSFYLYANKYLNNIHKIYEEQSEKFKLITCRHIDNSFKLHFISLKLNAKKSKLKEIETYSHICEDFVMCCKTISNNSFIIGLRNGKLIKATIHEFNINNNDEKNKKKIPNRNYEIIFDKYITGHIGSINVLETDERLGIIITAGDDNKIFIRKLYDFELLTCIKLKKKFIITMAKVSSNNLLYVLCFNKKIGKSIIFGYSLSGLKFAKSDYSFYTNIEFTSGGNVVTLENNSILTILNGYNLKEIEIDENDDDFQKFLKMLQSFNSGEDKISWIQFNDFKKYYGTDRSIITFTKENNKKSFIYQNLKVTNISYFE